MDAEERNRLIAATRGFNQLRGLYYAPMAMLNAVYPALETGWPRGGAVREYTKLAILLCAIAGCFAGRSYYRRRFGVVRQGYVTTWMGALGFLALWGAQYVDLHGLHPASLVCVWWAAFYLVCYLFPYRLRDYSLWFAALFLVLGFVTQLGLLAKQEFNMSGTHVGDIVIWLALSLHGLLDHQLLVRLLPRATVNEASSTEHHG